MRLELKEAQLTADDYVAAQRLHGRWRLWWVGIFLLVALCLVSLVESDFGRRHISALVAVPWLVWLGVILLIHYWYTPWKCRRLFRQQKTLQQISDKVIDDEKLSIDSAYGSVRIPWSDFHKWKSNKQLVLLYQSPRIFSMMPRRWFAHEADYAAFRHLLATTIAPENKPRK